MLFVTLYQPYKISYFNFGSIEKGTQIPETQTTDYAIGPIIKSFVSTLLAFAVHIPLLI